MTYLHSIKSYFSREIFFLRIFSALRLFDIQQLLLRLSGYKCCKSQHVLCLKINFSIVVSHPQFLTKILTECKPFEAGFYCSLC